MSFHVDLDVNDNYDVEPFVETDPTGRYGRYAELLGAGAVKKVYKAFDVKQGKEVAWNQVLLRKFINDEYIIDKIFNEVCLLKNLKNDNVIPCYDSWTDDENLTLNFITEFCISGNLREYREKHRRVSLNAIKKWSRQILKGLDYLHSGHPSGAVVIHRDLNCSNVFINGNSGQVKIGDLGLATVTKRKNEVVRSVVGTPEYMAPEIFEKKYTETVDVYAFGLCVLELVTNEIPYSECDSIGKIFKKVTSGQRPRAMNNVKDPDVKRFIEKCLVRQPQRPSVAQLLEDQFFDGLEDDDDDSNDEDEISGFKFDISIC